jgi:hypothetical protein
MEIDKENKIKEKIRILTDKIDNGENIKAKIQFLMKGITDDEIVAKITITDNHSEVVETTTLKLNDKSKFIINEQKNHIKKN